MALNGFFRGPLTEAEEQEIYEILVRLAEEARKMQAEIMKHHSFSESAKPLGDYEVALNGKRARILQR